jgi:hypothetical protein
LLGNAQLLCHNANMILPQYSLRKLLASIVGVALFCMIVSWGLRGSGWAFGVSLAGLSIAVALFVQALFFWIAWLFASLIASRQSHKAGQTVTSASSTPALAGSDAPAQIGGDA